MGEFKLITLINDVILIFIISFQTVQKIWSHYLKKKKKERKEKQSSVARPVLLSMVGIVLLKRSEFHENVRMEADVALKPELCGISSADAK